MIRGACTQEFPKPVEVAPDIFLVRLQDSESVRVGCGVSAEQQLGVGIATFVGKVAKGHDLQAGESLRPERPGCEHIFSV